MNRRTLIAGLASAATLVAAAPAWAISYAEDVVRQLTALGFTDIRVETTLLGRIKIVAARADGLREIVLNPRTGEILRDVWLPSTGGGLRNVLVDVDDDDDDDDKDDDNSGSGSGGGDDDDDKDDDNSGSGSGSDDDDDREDDRDDERDDREDREDDRKDD